MHSILIIALLGLILLAVGCGEDEDFQSGSLAELQIRQEFVGQAVYTEGAKSYIKLSDDQGGGHRAPA